MAHFEGVKKLGIIFKGKSIEKIHLFEGKFAHAFIVNNFDLEYDTVRPHLDGVEIIQFVNKLQTAILSRQHYEGFGIKKIQTNMALAIPRNKKAFRRMLTDYEPFDLEVFSLPEEMLKYNRFFTKRGIEGYKYKHPNTGLLALCYALEYISPSEIFMCGLDFYQTDYKFRRKHQNPQRKQIAKMNRTKMVEHFIELVRSRPEIKFTLGSYYDNFPRNVPNLEIV